MLKVGYIHNCHSGLDPESHQRDFLTSNVFVTRMVRNAGKILNQVQDDSKKPTLQHFTS